MSLLESRPRWEWVNGDESCREMTIGWVSGTRGGVGCRVGVRDSGLRDSGVPGLNDFMGVQKLGAVVGVRESGFYVARLDLGLGFG